ncbi:MAG: glycoside hydrolase family 30 beta sandwich domain-containing protein [Chitinophagaceae bacterium]
MKKIFSFLLLLSFIVLASSRCKKSSDTGSGTTPPVTPPVTTTNDVDFWLTKSDQSVLLQKQSTTLSFNTTANTHVNIEVDTTVQYQTIDGFGYTLTGGSAQVINNMAAADKVNLLQELFGSGSTAIGISYLRISIGASDLNAVVFSYDDVPTGQTDAALANFSLDKDKETGTGLIPLLKQIIAINPNIKIIATPWSPPVWMKDNGNSVGGGLQTLYYNVYAQYFVKYIQAMKAEGITITAITPQNEPLNPGNNPSLQMIATQERDFIKNSLGPAFQAAGLTTKIIAYDHNCDHPDYPLTILSDPAAKAFVDGSAFHLYAGDISALGQVHDAYPDKNLYFTEQYTASTGDFGGDLKWHLKNVIIGSMRNWSRNALEWNLANDANFQPYTPGGCNTCKGALTISSTVTRNVAYYIIAHASKFVPAGSVRIATNIFSNLQNVAFKTPTGKKVLIVENDGTTTAVFNIKFNSKWVPVSLDAGSVGTYTW